MNDSIFFLLPNRSISIKDFGVFGKKMAILMNAVTTMLKTLGTITVEAVNGQHVCYFGFLKIVFLA